MVKLAWRLSEGLSGHKVLDLTVNPSPSNLCYQHSNSKTGVIVNSQCSFCLRVGLCYQSGVIGLVFELDVKEYQKKTNGDMKNL